MVYGFFVFFFNQLLLVQTDYAGAIPIDWKQVKTLESDQELLVKQDAYTGEKAKSLKAAEDGNGLIVRLYESQRCRGPVTLKAGYPIHQAWRTNLLEEAQEELDVKDNQVKFSVKPYQIVTLRVV